MPLQDSVLIRLLFTSCLLAGCTNPVAAQDESDPFRGRTFGFKTYSGFAYSTLVGAGGNRLNLILNSGAHSTILTEDALAACPEAKYLRDLTVRFPTGNVAGKEYSVSGLTWDGVRLGRLTVFVLDRDRDRLLLDSHLDGFLGFPLFEGRSVRFQFSSRTLSFLRTYDEADYPAKAEFSLVGHHPRLRGTIQGEAMEIELATSLVTTQVSVEALERAKVPVPKSSSHPASIDIPIPAMKVGTFEATRLNAIVKSPPPSADGSKPDVALGNSFLIQHEEVVIDFARRRLLAKFRSPEEAESSLATRASAGDGAAALMLARARLREAVEKPAPEAVQWIAKAAELGDVESLYVYGKMLLNGEEGVQKDEAAAYRALSKAADSGQREARSTLGMMKVEGDGTPKDVEGGLAMLRRGANEGNREAAGHLAALLLTGSEGVTKDIDEGFKWTRLAAGKGYADARTNLGYCFMNGVGVSKDVKEGLAWYQRAAAQGNAQAMNNLGWSYETGEAGEVNWDLARDWYSKAAARGHEKAKLGLERLRGPK
jgi:TPR repeat protein